MVGGLDDSVREVGKCSFLTNFLKDGDISWNYFNRPKYSQSSLSQTLHSLQENLFV